MYDIIELDHPLAYVVDELQKIDGLIQLGIGALGIAIAWWIGGRIRRALAASERFQRFVPASALLPPFLAWTFIWLAGLLMAVRVPANVLALIGEILGAFALARFVVFALRRSFPSSGLLAAFEWVISLLIWTAFVLHITRVLPAITKFLNDIAIPIGKQTVTALSIVQGGFLVVVTLLVALWIGTTVDARLMRAESLHSSLRTALSRSLRSFLLILAILIVLPLIGVDLTVLSVFGGALGVGLGFGLQKIASNYMSGFIVLFERSVRIKDLVTIDKFYGEVRTLTTRYVVLRSLDGREAIIPNEKLITDVVINHSYTDPRVWVSTAVQVTYDTNIDRVLEILIGIARRHPRVLADPPPHGMLSRFADSGIELELGFWIADPERGTGGVKSDINIEIWRTFKHEGIEIAFPRQDLRILSLPKSA